jgi:diacylglycerol kinase (ATP)
MLRERINSFRFAAKGVAHLLQREPHARFHLLASVLVIIAGGCLGLSQTEWALVALCIGMVFSAEGFNTAVERLTDLASPGTHPLAGQAKDVAAGAVLLASIAAATVGGIVFLPKIMALLFP